MALPRPDSPVPPPMPSPTLKPMPLPSPPARRIDPYSRERSNASPLASSSCSGTRRPFPVDAPDSPVFSLKDALVVSKKPRTCSGGSSRGRDENDDVELLDLDSDDLPRGRPGPASPPPRLKHRRSDSVSLTSSTGTSSTALRPRTRSPRPRRSADSEIAPPVPQLKGIPSRLPIRIPELGLGIDESLRSPISSSSHSSSSTSTSTSSYSFTSSASSQSTPKTEFELEHSFLHLTAPAPASACAFDPAFLRKKQKQKHVLLPPTPSPVPGCLATTVRVSHSLPDIKAKAKTSGKVFAKTRNNNGSTGSFANRFLRIGVH